MSRQRRAFTLVELVLALVVASLVALAATGTLFATGSAAASQLDAQAITSERRLALARLAPPIRESARVLARTDERLVLWVGDRTGDGLINLSELRVLDHDADSGVVRTYDVDPGLVIDTVLDATADFAMVAGDGMSDGSLVGRVIVTGVTEWETTLDASAVHEARAVRVSLGMTSEQGDQAMTFIAVLRTVDF